MAGEYKATLALALVLVAALQAASAQEGLVQGATHSRRLAQAGACSDVAPDTRFTCQQQASFGRCQSSWMLAGNFCQRTCNRCPGAPAPERSPAPASPKPAAAPVAPAPSPEARAAPAAPAPSPEVRAAPAGPAPSPEARAAPAAPAPSPEARAAPAAPAPSPEVRAAPAAAAPAPRVEAAPSPTAAPRVAAAPSPERRAPAQAAPAPTVECTDISPDELFTCAEQAAYGKCSAGWLIAGGYCQRSCGRCPGAAVPQRAALAPAPAPAPEAPAPRAAPAPAPEVTARPPAPAPEVVARPPAAAPAPEVPPPAPKAPAPAPKVAAAPVPEKRAPAQPSPSPSGGCVTAAQMVLADPAFNIFATLAEASGVMESLDSSDNLFMAFVPNNTAFQASFQGLNLSEQELLRDPELLRAVLQYHVVPERTLTTAQLNSNDRLPTLAPGQLLEVEKPSASNLTFLQGAIGYPQGQIVVADRPACRGLFNQINSVLISPQADRLLVARGKVAGRK